MDESIFNIDEKSHKKWYYNNLLHHLDGPAVEEENCIK